MSFTTFVCPPSSIKVTVMVAISRCPRLYKMGKQALSLLCAFCPHSATERRSVSLFNCSDFSMFSEVCFAISNRTLASEWAYQTLLNVHRHPDLVKGHKKILRWIDSKTTISIKIYPNDTIHLTLLMIEIHYIMRWSLKRV